MRYDILRSKSFEFAIKIIEFYKYSITTGKEYILSKQLLRSGTSIGANIEESVGSVSSKEFVFKMSIAYKEARETCYWIKLIKVYTKGDNRVFNELNLLEASCVELLKILVTIIKKEKKRLDKVKR